MSHRANALAVRLEQGAHALATLANAREREPRNAMILVDVGTAALMGGDAKRAREAFEAALAVNPTVARAHSSLGFLDGEAGRVGEALEHWNKAIGLDAGEREDLLAQGALLVRRGRSAQARPYLELFVASAPTGATTRDVEQARRWLSATK